MSADTFRPERSNPLLDFKHAVHRFMEHMEDPDKDPDILEQLAAVQFIASSSFFDILQTVPNTQQRLKLYRLAAKRVVREREIETVKFNLDTIGKALAANLMFRKVSFVDQSTTRPHNLPDIIVHMFAEHPDILREAVEKAATSLFDNIAKTVGEREDKETTPLRDLEGFSYRDTAIEAIKIVHEQAERGGNTTIRHIFVGHPALMTPTISSKRSKRNAEIGK